MGRDIKDFRVMFSSGKRGYLRYNYNGNAERDMPKCLCLYDKPSYYEELDILQPDYLYQFTLTGYLRLSKIVLLHLFRKTSPSIYKGLSILGIKAHMFPFFLTQIFCHILCFLDVSIYVLFVWFNSSPLPLLTYDTQLLW